MHNDNGFNSKPTHELSDTANQLLEDGKEKLHDAKDKAQEMFDEGMKKACDMHQHLNDYMQDNLECMIKKVQEKPLASILIAGGVGFMLASMIRK
ncbi:MAG: hypothetical protein CMF38_01315 [Legionellaceae bacterium]|nr:hypothetical protein [Legionellaceae bacterium]HAF88140.1 hypothetical protein [Legionellales bacterium]|tara:strand:- start:1522 stop:1806 length:285 start_codon:yes stop_codon:yes gene_type:complete